jgi:hypothetical protein
MSLIEKAKGRKADQSPSGYTRLFGIPALGNLISRIQADVISAGNELENLIWERVTQIENIDHFLATTLHSNEDKMYVARKQKIKDSKIIKSQYEPDFLAFHPKMRHCYIIEVKDGDQFDTKKAAGERAMLQNFSSDISHSVPYITSIYMCSFNASAKDEIYNGLKRKFSVKEVMTGRELCDLFRIDYDEIINIRKSDQQKNLKYFTRELITIVDVREEILDQIEASSGSRRCLSNLYLSHRK